MIFIYWFYLVLDLIRDLDLEVIKFKFDNYQNLKKKYKFMIDKVYFGIKKLKKLRFEKLIENVNKLNVL